MHEGTHLVVILDPHRRLDSARNVDSIGLELGHDLAHVTRFETTGDEYLPSYHQLSRELPIPGAAGAAALVPGPGIEHDRVGPGGGVGDLALADLQHFDDRAAGVETGLFGSVQLQDARPDEIADL